MKRSWTTFLLIAGLAGLLALLAGLQYRWLSRISESDGEKARSSVKNNSERFAEDFNREIQQAYFNFQTEAESWKKKDWASFNERFDFWRGKTAYPDLITEFYFFEANSKNDPLKYDRQSRSFLPAESSPEFVELRSRMTDEKHFQPVLAEAYTLLLPIHDTSRKADHIYLRSPEPTRRDQELGLPERYGYLAIKLDPATIREKLLPDLVAKYFGDGEFRAVVVEKSGQPIFGSLKGESTDATSNLFDLSPANIAFFTNKELLSSISGEKHETMVVNSRIESHTFNRSEPLGGDQGTLKIEVKRDATPRTSIFTATTDGPGDSGPWLLEVQHSSGSLDTFIANTLRRNLAIGFGILLLLASAIAAIIISAMRVKMLAQRQVDFVSSVSHEFRTPVAVIYSAGENLADGVATEFEQVSRYGNLIKGEGRKLSGMVEQILDFAGANSGRKRYNFSENSVAAIVDDALADCQPLIVDKEINVETNVSHSLPTINADRNAISQAIQNLIVNSVKYGNGEKWLRVTAEKGGSAVRISVEDHGIGISKSDLRQIFEPFYRSKEVVDAQINGNGLGLALVKQIAEAHGGKVRAESEKGKGSRFTIELPV